VAYHDEEWGVPVWDDRALFEKLILDGFQAGLSWLTILRKRENFISAFDGFDPQIIASYGPDKVEALMGDAGIVRNRAKIEATIRNAQGWLNIMAWITPPPRGVSFGLTRQLNSGRSITILKGSGSVKTRNCGS